MKFSIITAVLNNRETISDCIESVASQSYKFIEHIIIDGLSTDGTIDIIKDYSSRYSHIRWISEKDNGIYNAINKGIKISTGEIIGILNSDDIFDNKEVLSKIAKVFQDYNVDSCYGDLLYVDRQNVNKVIRYWKSREYKKGLFNLGWHPAHPTFYTKKELFNKYGLYRTDFIISADYELMLRFFEKYNITSQYIPEIIVRMRIGGKSNKSVNNIFIQTKEDYRSWKVNKLQCGILPIILKKFSKIKQYFKRY